MPESAKKAQFVESAHFLRGLAAMLVVVDHSVGWIELPLLSWLFWVIDGHGQLGVSVFFVISGFVLPLSLGSSYRLSEFPRFVLRRFVRIEPTYVVSILVAGTILYAKTRRSEHGEPWMPNWAELGAHLCYLVPFTGYHWLNEVYWTLAIEFQYYLLIGLSLPAYYWLKRRFSWGAEAFILGFSILISLSVLAPKIGLLQYAPLFGMGIASYHAHTQESGLGRTVLLCAPISIIGILGGLSWTTMLVGAISAILISHWDAPKLRLRWFGTISYSLYVVHYPIVTFINQTAIRVLDDRNRHLNYLVPVLCILASIMAAWGLYRLVERPTQQFSRKLKRSE